MKSLNLGNGPQIVGSIGSIDDFQAQSAAEVETCCDLVEIRLDLLRPEALKTRPWRMFSGLPLLFTARCESEGGARGLDVAERMRRLEMVLDDAALVDIELASAAAMADTLRQLKERSIPWVASFHDFHGIPALDELEARRDAARKAGASGFKAAVALDWHSQALGALSLFLDRADDFPVSLMGMGPLAPTSRLLFAQLGSTLNYGYLGQTPTAPGQWSAAQLASAIHSVEVRACPN